MKHQAEVTAHEFASRTLIECTACGPVAVSDLSATAATAQHINEHQMENA